MPRTTKTKTKELKYGEAQEYVNKKTTKRSVRKPFIDLYKVEREKLIKDLEKQMDQTDFEFDEIGVDNDPGIDVPLHTRGGHFKWNFEEDVTPWYDKVTWVLTAVNVAIFISLVIKNV